MLNLIFLFKIVMTGLPLFCLKYYILYFNSDFEICGLFLNGTDVFNFWILTYVVTTFSRMHN